MRNLIIACAVSAALATAATWNAQEWRHGQRYSNLQLKYEQQYAAAQAEYRRRESELQEAISIIDRGADEQKKKLENDIATARDSADGLRKQLSDLAERHRKNSAASGQCSAESIAIDMLAELHRESEYLAREYAGEADRARIAGKLCESAYDKVSANKL